MSNIQVYMQKNQFYYFAAPLYTTEDVLEIILDAYEMHYSNHDTEVPLTIGDIHSFLETDILEAYAGVRERIERFDFDRPYSSALEYQQLQKELVKLSPGKRDERLEEWWFGITEMYEYNMSYSAMPYIDQDIRLGVQLLNLAVHDDIEPSEEHEHYIPCELRRNAPFREVW